MHNDAATADKLQGQTIQGQTPDHLGAKEAPEGGAQAHAPRARQARRLQAQALRAEFGGGGGAEVVGEGGGQRGAGAELVTEAPREGQGESKGRGEVARRVEVGAAPSGTARGRALAELGGGELGEAGGASAELGRGVGFEYGFHKVWAGSPLGNGAGDYGTFGEVGSVLRVRPTLEALGRGLWTSAGRDGSALGVKALGEGVFQGLGPLMVKYGKFVPIAGGVLSITGGLYTLGQFNLHDALGELSGVASEEGWREDPFGRMADIAHLVSSWVVVAHSSLDVLGGFVDVLSGLSLLTVAGAAAAPVGAELAEVIKVAAYVLENGNNIVLKPYVMCLRFLSALSAQVDAAGLNKILKKFEAETADALGGIVNGGLNVAGGVPKGLDGVDFNGKAKVDDFNAPALEKAPAVLLGSQFLGQLTGGGEAQVHASLQRWMKAQEVLEQERGLLNLKDIERGMDLPVPVLVLSPFVAPLLYGASQKAEPYMQATLQDLAPLPEAPCDLGELGHERAVLSDLRQRLKGVRGRALPALRGLQEGCREEGARGDELLGAHERLVGQQELAQGALGERVRVQGEAEQRWSEAQEKRAAASLDGDPRLQELERHARKVLAVIGAVPRELLPDNIGRAAQAARQALGMGDELGRLKEADAQGRVGGDLLQRNQAEIQEGELGLEATRKESARLQEAGQRHKTQAEALAEEVERALEEGRADEEEIEFHIQALEERSQRRAQELEAWAQAHEGRRGRNDRLAESLLSGAIFEEGGGAVGEGLCKARVRASLAVRDCAKFLREVQAQASPEALVHDAGLCEFMERYNVVAILHDGLWDCQESQAGLDALSPAQPASVWEERIGQAFDRVGRCRERLRLLPRAQVLQGSPQEHATPSAPAGQEVVAPRAQVYFGCDAPREGEVGEGGVVRRVGLREVLAYLGGREGAQVRVVGHASVEGSARHNQRLSERRARLVEGLLRPAGGHEVRVEARGEDEAQRAQTGGEYAHEAWRRVDVEVGGGSARAAG